MAFMLLEDENINKELKNRQDHLSVIQDIIDDLIEQKHNINAIVISYEKFDPETEETLTISQYHGGLNRSIGLAATLHRDILDSAQKT